MIGARVLVEGFVASREKLPRHLFRRLVRCRTRWAEDPIAIGTTEQTRFFAPDELTHAHALRTWAPVARIQAEASFVMPEASRPLAMSILVELYFSGAAFVSAAANAPRVRSVFSGLPFR